MPSWMSSLTCPKWNSCYFPNLLLQLSSPSQEIEAPHSACLQTIWKSWPLLITPLLKWCKLPSLLLIITHISTLSPHFPCASQAICIQFSSVQSLSHVRLFATPWIAAYQASLSITNSWSLLKFMSIESVMPSSHLILCLCCPLLLLPPIPPSIRVFSNESTLHMR